MPKKPAIERELTPEQVRSADFVIKTELAWRLADSQTRSKTTQKELAELISSHYSDHNRKLSTSGYGAWRSGRNIPDVESAEAFIRFFQVNPNDAYTAFGHQIPMTFAAFYDIASRTAKEEKWSDAENILSNLGYTKTPEWENQEAKAHWTISLARQLLQDTLDIHTKAERISELVDGFLFIRQSRRQAN